MPTAMWVSIKVTYHWHQGDHSFSTMIFYDFSMTKKNEFPWPIGTAYFFEINDTRFMNAYQNKNISSFQLQAGWYLQKQKF